MAIQKFIKTSDTRQVNFISHILQHNYIINFE